MKTPKINFEMVESFLTFVPVGNFLYNLDYIDDPLFLEASEATLNSEVPVHSKLPMTLTGYGLFDSDNTLIGFSCIEPKSMNGPGNAQ